MRFNLLHLAPLLSLWALPSAQAQEVQLDCPDDNLATYLIHLIDTLYGNGLTIYEQLLVKIAETDAGYDYLTSLYSDDASKTMLVPTDSAFQMAGIWGPFDHQTEKQLIDLVEFHTLQGSWTYDKLPKSPLHGVANTTLIRGSNAGNGTNGTSTGGYAGMVLVQGEKNSMIVKTAYGNATTWSGPVDTKDKNLTNLVIIPVDQIIGFPPKLSDALKMPTTSKSPKGLAKLDQAIAAISSNGTAPLEGLSGITVFAPVDEAFTDDVMKQAGNKDVLPTLLGNHYITKSVVYSPSWINGTTELQVVSTAKLQITTDDTGSYVSLGDIKAKILRSDIMIDNGVLHVIDKVLMNSGTPPSTLKGTGLETAGGAKGTAAGTAAATATGTGNIQAASTKAASSASGRYILSSTGVTIFAIITSALFL